LKCRNYIFVNTILKNKIILFYLLSITELIEKANNKPISNNLKALVLEICCNDKKGNDIEVPYVKYFLPRK
jgi:hypothetical protein